MNLVSSLRNKYRGRHVQPQQKKPPPFLVGTTIAGFCKEPHMVVEFFHGGHTAGNIFARRASAGFFSDTETARPLYGRFLGLPLRHFTDVPYASGRIVSPIDVVLTIAEIPDFNASGRSEHASTIFRSSGSSKGHFPAFWYTQDS